MEMDLRDVLIHTHTIQRLEARTPTEGAALLRLLMDFTEAAYCPLTPEDRQALPEAGAFDPSILDGNITSCKETGDSFFLDDLKRPFMQSTYDEGLDAKAEKPVSTFLMDLLSGNNRVFIDHRLAKEHAVSLAHAFKAIPICLLFCAIISITSAQFFSVTEANRPLCQQIQFLTVPPRL